ncbi:MAG: hypothetical protein VX527_10160 [Planctomycetota bacterium]|nr:hypothetical protein [Planctomycetota bacterium]
MPILGLGAALQAYKGVLRQPSGAFLAHHTVVQGCDMSSVSGHGWNGPPIHPTLDMIQSHLGNSISDDASTNSEAECGCCPWVDHTLSECRSRFQLQSIQQAMATCFGDWSTCPVYRALAQKGSSPEREIPVAVVLTVRQHEHVHLRPTGS